MFGFCRDEAKQTDIESGHNVKPAAVTKLAYDPETNLERYLAYYVGRLEPGYAVLVTGDWGTGKTFQVRKALPDDLAHYVSLFGLSTPEIVEAQVFTKMHPRQAATRKFADKTDNINIQLPIIGGLGTGGLASAMVDVFIKNEVDNSKPLIFDDLERCPVEIKIILGLINRYVEHHGCRVIVIAHDEKIMKEFAESKEKVFGQTLLVEPNFDSAFAEFNSIFAKRNNEDGLGNLMNEVLSIYRESEASSLRVLRHVVEDVTRLSAALDKRHLEHRIAMVELIRLFSALAIETRSNCLDKASLRNRQKTSSNYSFNLGANKGNKQDPPRIVKAASKYSSVDILSTLLNDEVLIAMLIEGRFVEEQIRESLNAHAYFLEKQSAQPWQIVGSFDKLEDSVVEQAVKNMEEQFAKREITESGELLHIVALKMMMASKKLTKNTAKQVAAAAKVYIDDLLKNGSLPPRTAGSMWHESFEGSYAGVSYWVTDAYKVEFQEVFDYLIDARSKAMESTYPELIPPLLQVVQDDGQKFFEKVCYTHSGTIEYEDLPILAHISVNDFVDAWLASPRAGWYWIGNALKERNKASHHYPSLKPEVAWYRKVALEMEKRAKQETGLAQLRIIRTAGLIGLPHAAPKKSRVRRAAPKASKGTK